MLAALSFVFCQHDPTFFSVMLRSRRCQSATDSVSLYVFTAQAVLSGSLSCWKAKTLINQMFSKRKCMIWHDFRILFRILFKNFQFPQVILRQHSTPCYDFQKAQELLRNTTLKGFWESLPPWKRNIKKWVVTRGYYFFLQRTVFRLLLLVGGWHVKAGPFNGPWMTLEGSDDKHT